MEISSPQLLKIARKMTSSTPINDFYDICKRNGILLDTNMLILYIVGQNGEEAVKNESLLHSEKHSHSWDDFKVVKQLVDISATKQFFFTPFSTPEVSHLLDIEQNRQRCKNSKTHKYHNSIIETLCNGIEISNPTRNILQKHEHLLERFGIADLSIINTAFFSTKPVAVLSDDEPLCDLLQFNNLPAISLARLNALGICNQNLIARMNTFTAY